MTGDHHDLAALIDSERPHLVLLDLMLPDSDGIELMRRVAQLAEQPVIFISAYGRDETIAKAMTAAPRTSKRRSVSPPLSPSPVRSPFAALPNSKSCELRCLFDSGLMAIGAADRTNNRSKPDGCEVRLIDGALGGSLQRRPLSPLRMWRWALETERPRETAITCVAVAAWRQASDERCEVSYRDRGGKYQGQTGVTLPKP